MKKMLGVGAGFLFFLFSFAVLAGCGGGGSSSSSPAAPPSQTSSTVSGVASKGLIAGGDVAVYEIDAGGRKVLPALATGTTGNDGRFSLPIDFAGPVLVEISSGQYIDEASGVTTPITQALRAALPSADGDVQVAVTPLTELAVRMAEAGGGLLPDKITSANQLLSQLLGPGADIIGTEPADPNSDTAFSGASAEGQNYALLLAAISQIAYSSGYDVMDVVKAFEEDIQDLEMDFIGPILIAAVAEFLDTNPHNNTGADSSDAGALTGVLNSIVADGLTPTGSLIEAKELLASFLQDPSQANYDTLMTYLNAFAPASQEAYLFKAIASLLNIYQSSAAQFITSGQEGFNLSTDFETFDANQFMDGLLHSAAIHTDILDLFAEISDRLGDTYSNLEQAEGVNTFISLAGFDTVYLDDVDVKILKAMTRAWQSVFILAQAIDLEVDNWEVASGTGTTVDVRDLIAGDQPLSQAQHDEFMASNPDLFGYANLPKLAEFQTAVAQAAADLADVVTALEALGASGREARSHNAFNIDSDRDFYMLKAISEHTMASLVAAMKDPATVIETPSDEDTGGSLVMAGDGYTYMQTEHNIYLTPHTPAQGQITLYDLANGIQSLRDLYEAASATEDYEPYQEGSPSLFQSGIMDMEWDWPIESVEIDTAPITIDGSAADWAAVPVSQSINGFTIKMAAGSSGQDYYVYISNPPVANGAGGYYYLGIGSYWPWWMAPPPSENYFNTSVFLNNNDPAFVSGSENGQNDPDYLSVAENDKAIIQNAGNVVGVELKFSQLDRLTGSDYVNYYYLIWDLNGSSGDRAKDIKIYP